MDYQQQFNRSSFSSSNRTQPPLRQRSPPGQHQLTLTNAFSPQTSDAAPETFSPPVRDTSHVEWAQALNKGAHLRSQIQLKQRELESIYQTKERINQLIMDQQSRQSFRQSENRGINPYQRSESMLEEDRVGGQIQTSTFQNLNHSSSRDTQLMKKENIANLSVENAQLQRRLNLVSAELDRVSLERDHMSKKLKSVAHQSSDMAKQIEFEQTNDTEAHNFQHQLANAKRTSDNLRIQIDNVKEASSQMQSSIAVLKSDRERHVEDCHAMTHGLQTKLTVIQELEHEQFHAQQLLEQTSDQIYHCEQQLRMDHNQTSEMDTVIRRLMRERDVLQEKLARLSEAYDRTVEEITAEQAILSMNHTHHLQLMAAKAMHQSLYAILFSRKQSVMQDFQLYCKFDADCHDSLRAFARVLEKCGSLIQSRAIKVWFKNAHMPIAKRKCSDQIVDNLYKTKVRSKVFRQWINVMKHNRSAYGDMINAVNRIWQIKYKCCKTDVRRAFIIWTALIKFLYQRETRLNIVIQRTKSRLLHKALHSWQRSCDYLGFQVRTNILAYEVSNRQLLHIAFSQLSVRARLKKRIRLMRLRHFMKSWRDGIQYYRYITCQNVMLKRLNKDGEMRTLAACFSALRHHKETQKFSGLNEKLMQNVIPQTSTIVQTLGARSQNLLVNRKLRALRCIVQQGMCGVRSYFERWLVRVRQLQQHRLTNFKQMLMRVYHLKLHTALGCFRQGAKSHAIQTSCYRISQLTSQQVSLTREDSRLKSHIAKERERVFDLQRQSLQRICANSTASLLKSTLRLWSGKNAHLASREQAAKFVISFVRKNYCAQSFSLLQKAVLTKMQKIKSKNRALDYQQRRQARAKRYVFDAFCAFVEEFRTQRRNFDIAYRAVNCWMQRKAFYCWLENASHQHADKLKSRQFAEVDKFEIINEHLGQVVRSHTAHSGENSHLQSQLTSQANHVLANYFQRFYYVKAERGLQKWKDFVHCQQHKERILESVTQKLKKSQFYCVKAGLQNWIQKANIRTTNNQIRHTEILIQDQTSLNDNHQQLHAQTVNCINSEEKCAKVDSRFVGGKFGLMLEILARKAQSNDYQSVKRHLLTEWLRYTKSRKASVQAIISAAEKSFWKIGFHEIQAFCRDKDLTRQQNVCLKGMSRMFWRKAVGQQFQAWRDANYSEVKQATMHTLNETVLKLKKHQEWKTKVQNWNCMRSFVYQFERKNLQSLFHAWQNVIRWLKTKREVTRKFRDVHLNYRAARLLRKWKQRQEATQRQRGLRKVQNDRRELALLRTSFRCLQRFTLIEKSFCQKLSTVAKSFDTRILQLSLKTIKGFAECRLDVNLTDQLRAATQLNSVLDHLFRNKMTANLSDLRVICLRKKKIQLATRTWFQRQKLLEQRRSFFQWRASAQKLTVADDVNEQGPVVEQVLDWQMRLRNQRLFLEEQGYSGLEIQKVIQVAKDRADEQLMRSVRRMQHHADDDKDRSLLPKVFDRWVMFVKVRRAVSRIQNFIMYRLQPVMADVGSAFRRWKYDIAEGIKQSDASSLAMKEDLLKRCSATQNRAQRVLTVWRHANAFKDELKTQRDELIQRFINSQRFAFKLYRDNRQRLYQSGLAELSHNAMTKKREQLENLLEQNLQVINDLKGRIADYEHENQAVAEENEELRIFSMSGYNIAKNVQQLNRERESLSVDLADKAQLIKDLLADNEIMSLKLRQVQEMNLVRNGVLID